MQARAFLLLHGWPLKLLFIVACKRVYCGLAKSIPTHASFAHILKPKVPVVNAVFIHFVDS